MSEGKELECLVGRTVKEIFISEGEREILFKLESGALRDDEIAFGCWGDCCSDTWIADIVSPRQLLGKVERIEFIPLPAPCDTRTRQECDKAYGVMFVTSNGRSTLIFRNSSNGYYGGDLSKCDKVPPAKWKKVDVSSWEDWAAPGNAK